MTSFREDFTSAIDQVATIVNRYRNVTAAYKDTSLVDVTKICRVEPLTVISRDLVFYDEMSSILQTNLNLFSAYYLQAIALQAQVKDIHVMKVLDKLNPDRDFSTVLMATESMKDHVECHVNAFKFRLPTSANKVTMEEISDSSNLDVNKLENEIKRLDDELRNVSSELGKNSDTSLLNIKSSALQTTQEISEINDGIKVLEDSIAYDNARIDGTGDPAVIRSAQAHMRQSEQSLRKEKERLEKSTKKLTELEIQQKSIEDNKDKLSKRFTDLSSLKQKLSNDRDEAKNKVRTVAYDSKPITEINNLAVGKILDVTINVDNHVMKIPVRVSLAPVSIQNASIAHILAKSNEDHGFVERFHSWRAGTITSADLIFCLDMIKEHKKALITDTTGIYAEITRRANRAKGIGLMTNNPSLASASNIFIISANVAREIEHKLGGKLSNARVRDKAFDNTYAMLLTVVDVENERVSIYHRGIATATEVSLRDIKNSNKGSSGADIGDMLKSFMRGNAPTF